MSPSPRQQQPEPVDPDAAAFLVTAAEQLADLRGQAATTAAAIAAAAPGASSGSERAVDDLARSLIERSEAIASETQRLSAVLDRVAASQTGRELPTRPGPARPSAPPDPAGPAEPGSVSEGVKLLVTQMAVAGAPRAEIEQRLVADFGIDDPSAVLRDLFGAA